MGAHERNLKLEGLHHVADEVVASLHMLHAIVVLGVVRDVARTLTVAGKFSRARLGRIEPFD